MSGAQRKQCSTFDVQRSAFGVAFFVLLWLPAVASAAELKPLFQAPKADDLLTWEIAGAPPAWFSLDVTKTPMLTVTAPDGVVWRRAAYVDQTFGPNPALATAKTEVPELVPTGERVLRVRHTARLLGVHRWTLADPAGAEVAKGQVTVGAAAGPVGPLAISRDNPRLLAFKDGAIFIAIGPNIAWADGPDRLAKFVRYLAALRQAGGTHFRLWCASWCGQIEGDEPDAYRLDQAWLLDQILATARANQLRATVVLDNHHDFVRGLKFPYGGDYLARVTTFLAAPPPAQYERRLRYELARWGADDTIAAWELFNELDQAQPLRATGAAWVQGAATLLANLDQDHRLRTVSWCSGDWDAVMALPDLDLVQIHAYVQEWTDPLGLVKERTRDGVGMLLGHAERANRTGRPFCFGETGYQGLAHSNPGNDLDREGLLLRQQVWAGFLLGGYGTGMNWWWDVYLDAQSLWGPYRGFARVVERLDWRDRALTPITPNQGSPLRVIGWQSPRQVLLWPQLRDDTWYAALIEGIPRPRLVRPVQIRLAGLRQGVRFAVHYLDPATGDEREKRDAASDAGGSLELTVSAQAGEVVMWVEEVK